MRIRWLAKAIRSKFTRFTTFSLFLSVLVFSSNAMASASLGDVSWFIALLSRNNGRKFCVPPKATLQDVANVLSQYARAHPELHDPLTDPEAILALGETYPCIELHPMLQAFPVSPAGGQRQVQLQLHGEYATIDTKLAIATIRRLQGTVGHENDDLILEVENNSGNYAPPVLFALAILLYKQDRFDDAVFWFNAGRLRAIFDAARCTDVSARSAVPELTAQVPVELRRLQFNDLAKLKDAVRRVIRWDEDTPYNYDYRWINLHGGGAIANGLGNADAPNGPLSLPREEWDALAQETRKNYLREIDATIDTYQGKKSSN